MINALKVKNDFPIFRQHQNLTYLDSAATSLKPKSVIDKLSEYYRLYSANVFRGIYEMSERATEEYEETRDIVAKFIGAKYSKEIIFTRNATESINLVALTLGRKIVSRGDEIATSIMEHHSNFVPWQILAKEKRAILKIIDIDDNGTLMNPESIIGKRTKILALTHVSNVLGTINPIKKIIRRARAVNPKIIVVVDAAQSVPHLKINVSYLDCDFLAFSSHKMLGPTGVGVLWGKEELLREMPPLLFGGEMIDIVSKTKSSFKNPPYRFEAGTPNIAGVIALKEAISYLSTLGMNKVRKHEIELTEYALKRLKEEFGAEIKIPGPRKARERGGVISFTFKSYHPHDISQILAGENICIRAGHHCAMPLHKRLNLSATARASFYIYNQQEDIERLINGLKKADKILKI